jgi:hypothetical protein
MSNINCFEVGEDGVLKRIKHRMSLDKTGGSPITSGDRLAMRVALGLATGMQPYGSAPAYTSDYSAGADGTTATTGLSSVTGNVDAILDTLSGTQYDDTLRLTSDATNGAHYSTRLTTFTIGKRYRIEADIYIPATNATAQKIAVGAALLSGTSAVALAPTVGRWTRCAAEFTATATSTSMYLGLLTSAGASSFQGIAGEVAYIKNLTIYETGLNQFRSIAVALDFGSIAAAASADLTITLTGVAVGDSVALGLPAAPTAGIVFQAFVSAANTVTVRATNITGSAVDPASATYRVTVSQF